MLTVGLAPAADGGNRTGRIFTGDPSGDFLYGSLHRTEYANQPTSEKPGDGLKLSGMYVAAVNRCAPPTNKPTSWERDNCLPYLQGEIELLDGLRVIVALGGWAWNGVLQALKGLGHEIPRPRPKFAHGAEVQIGPYRQLGSYHPSPHNTYTGKLTPEMLDGIFERARRLTEG